MRLRCGSNRCAGVALGLGFALLSLATCHLTVNVEVQWGDVKTMTRTAATVEVDVMPFLGRTSYGGPFNAYYEALANLNAEFVRYSPWFPNPRVVVPELYPPDCTVTKPQTNWNSTLLDGIMRDFQAAVCGPDAVRGVCKHSVVQQLSTMPSWIYVGGCPASALPDEPWNTTNPFNKYTRGGELVDKSCGQMARHFARIVGWYTAGGFHDECGHWHESGLNYSWWGVSVLNEDEHRIQPDTGEAYTKCYDAIAAEVKKVNPSTTLVGPEIAGNLNYLLYFLNGSHHADGQAPAVSSYHQGMSASNDSAATFFTQWDSTLKTYVEPVEAFKKATGQATEMVLNEFIPFIGDWCDCTPLDSRRKGALCANQDFPKSCPNWQDPESAGGDPDLQSMRGVGFNKKTLSWNAAAGVFAYAYGTLAELNYKYVGQDQLVGGTWPDNEPAVSCMDWQSGQVNAKYWVTNLLATTVGDAREKHIVSSKLTVTGGKPPAPAGTTGVGTCGNTRYASECDSLSSGAWNTTEHHIASLAQCVDKAKGCQMGNYVGFSLKNEDCSWYQNCDMGELVKVGAGYESEVLHPQPGDAASKYLYVLPYIKDGRKGLMLVNKQPFSFNVQLQGVAGGGATIVEATGAEPSLNPPVARQISPEGRLALGAFAVAVVTEIKEA